MKRLTSRRSITCLALTLVLLATACRHTPGGDSESINRRISGSVDSTDIAWCGDGLTDHGYKNCADKCFHTSFICDYEIRVVDPATGHVVGFSDATYQEYKACPKGSHWPECCNC